MAEPTREEIEKMVNKPLDQMDDKQQAANKARARTEIRARREAHLKTLVKHDARRAKELTEDERRRGLKTALRSKTDIVAETEAPLGVRTGVRPKRLTRSMLPPIQK